MMQDFAERFENLEYREKMESSHKVVYTFIQNAVLFYASKAKNTGNQTMKRNKSTLETRINRMGHRHTKSKPSGVYQNQQPEKSNYQYNYNTGTYQRSPFRSDTASADKQVSERSQKTIQIKPTASIDTHSSMFDPHYKSFADQPSAPLTTDQDKN